MNNKRLHESFNIGVKVTQAISKNYGSMVASDEHSRFHCSYVNKHRKDLSEMVGSGQADQYYLNEAKAYARHTSLYFPKTREALKDVARYEVKK